jgi:hypothetical protein
MKKLLLLVLIALMPSPTLAGDTGTDILSAGMAAGYKIEKSTSSYIPLEKAEELCKQATCEAGYCDSKDPCATLKYDIFLSGCMSYIKR